MKYLYRDRWDKKVGGVCGGLGQFLSIDPTIIRLLAIVLCVITAVMPLLITYLISWMIMPLGPATYIQYKCMRIYRSRKKRKIAGICGGVAEILKVDETVVRIVTLVTMISTGFLPILIAYIVGMFIIPEKPGE